MPFLRRGALMILENSSRMRSGEMRSSSGAHWRIAASVFRSIVKPSELAKRAARSSRRPSSVKRLTGSPIARRMPALRSARPPTKSITSPVSGFSKSPLIVKSRRWASSFGLENSTDSGRRPSR